MFCGRTHDTGGVCVAPAALQIPASLSILATALGVSVAYIVPVGAEEEMRRVHAWGVITGMEDMHSLGDRAMCEYPGYAVGQRFEFYRGA